jgi:hypothetical protein
MLRAPLCPSSGAREYYTVGCRLWSLVFGFQFVGMVWSWGLCVRFAGCCSPRTGHTTLSSTPYQQLENQAPNTTGSNHLYNTLELLMMGIMVPETCWARNKICNKNSSVASSWHFISTYYRRCTVKPTSNNKVYFLLLVHKFSDYNCMFRPFLVAIIRLYIPSFKSSCTNKPTRNIHPDYGH